MTTEGEASTRDPFGGFLIGPMDFLFDFNNFPLNEELVNNYRTNVAGSRRSPLELENRVQYATSRHIPQQRVRPVQPRFCRRRHAVLR